MSAWAGRVHGAVTGALLSGWGLRLAGVDPLTLDFAALIHGRADLVTVGAVGALAAGTAAGAVVVARLGRSRTSAAGIDETRRVNPLPLDDVPAARANEGENRARKGGPMDRSMDGQAAEDAADGRLRVLARLIDACREGVLDAPGEALLRAELDKARAAVPELADLNDEAVVRALFRATRVGGGGNDTGEGVASAPSVGRRQLGGALAGAAVGAAVVVALTPRQAQAALHVFDSANLAKAAEYVSQAVKQVELLTDLARLDKTALKVLGEMGLPTEGASKLFGMVDSTMSILGSVQRLRSTPARFSRNLSIAGRNFQGMRDQLKTFDGARGLYERIYGTDGSEYGPQEWGEIELFRREDAEQQLIDAISMAASERTDMAENAERRMEELARMAEEASKGGEDGSNLRSQIAVSTSVQLATLEQLLRSHALLAAQTQALCSVPMAQQGLKWKSGFGDGGDGGAAGGTGAANAYGVGPSTGAGSGFSLGPRPAGAPE